MARVGHAGISAIVPVRRHGLLVTGGVPWTILIYLLVWRNGMRFQTKASINGKLWWRRQYVQVSTVVQSTYHGTWQFGIGEKDGKSEKAKGRKEKRVQGRQLADKDVPELESDDQRSAISEWKAGRGEKAWIVPCNTERGSWECRIWQVVATVAQPVDSPFM